MNTLLSISEATKLISSGACLSIAASEKALSQLPKGNWIGGTSSYFIGPNGGTKSNEQVFVTDLGEHGKVAFASYSATEVGKITPDSPDNGFTVAIVPAGSASLGKLAQRPYSDDMFMKPLVGWVSGIDLSELRHAAAKVVDGRTGTFSTDAVVVAHVTLPAGKMASVSITNPFQISKKRSFTFETGGFSATHCIVDGKKKSLVELLIEENNQTGKRPIIGDYAGANINVSIQSVECVSGKVEFYAPVFPNITYYFAEPLADYAGAFLQAESGQPGTKLAFSCNCILNYLYGDLEGKKIGEGYGPVTFGEIAYQLLNQTKVVLEIV